MYIFWLKKKRKKLYIIFSELPEFRRNSFFKKYTPGNTHSTSTLDVKFIEILLHKVRNIGM